MNTDKFDQALVTSYFAECMDIVHSEVKPGSSVLVYSTPLNQPASTVKSVDGRTMQTQYLQYPLYPIQGDVMDLSRSYIWLDYNLNFGLCIGHNTYADQYLFLGPKFSTSTSSRVQLAMNSQIIHDDQMNFLHAAIQSAGVCASEAEHSPEYATIDGLLKNKISCMRIIKIPKTSNITYDGNENTAFKEYKYSVNYNYSLDLNRASVILSNFQYMTIYDGALCITCFYDYMLDNFHYMMLPSENSLSVSVEGANGYLGCQSSNGIITINPVRWGKTPTTYLNNKKCVDFGTDYTEWVPIAAPYRYTAGSSSLGIAIADNNNGFVTKIASNGDLTNGAPPAGTGFISIPIMFTLNKGTNPYVLEFIQSQIYQYVLELTTEAKERLHQIFSQNNNIIVRPTQRFVTAPFTDSQIGPNPTSPPMTTLYSKLDANNITHIIVSQTINSQYGNSCLMNTFKNDYQVLAQGVPLNSLAYNKVDGRVIKDYTNAIWDTDNEEINNDYLYSITFPQYVAGENGNAPTDREYFIDGDFTRMKNINLNSSQKIYFKQPNLYFDVFSTSVPSSFMTGICIAPKFVGQLQVGLRSAYSSFQYMNDAKRYKPTPMKEADGTVNVLSFEALTLPSYIDRNTTMWCTVLHDCALVSMYDPNLRRANSASIIPTFPFADGAQ